MEMREITSDQKDKCNHVSIDVENQLNLVNFVRDKLRMLSPLSSECCIYRVPKQLRQASEKSFIPKVVSIGPLHRNREDLQEMEVHKLRYLKDFLQRTKVSLDDCIKLIKESEARVRNCYAETIEINSDSFVAMILVDATFIIEVLLRISFPELTSDNDCIVGRQRMLQCITHDMLLLENQIPFFVIEDLLSQAKIVFPPENDIRFTMFKLSSNLLISVTPTMKGKEGFINKQYSSRMEHFLDFVRSTLLPPQMPAQKNILKSLSSIPTITQLYQAGVKFKAQHSRNLLEIRFEQGILEIPCMYICVSREDLYKNLVAYEQCHFNDAYLSNFAFLMDRLIETSKDVEILIQNQILETNLADNQGVTTFIKNLAPGAIMIGDNFLFANLCEDLNAYCRTPWRKWKATLKRDYFSTPWAILSVITAVLLLTFLQTLFTIIPNRC